jgi:hypothetical protein
LLRLSERSRSLDKCSSAARRVRPRWQRELVSVDGWRRLARTRDRDATREEITMSEQRSGPAFTGLVVYRSREHGYSFLYPDGWHRLELASEGGQGIILAPAPDAVATSFSAEAHDLGTAITGDDFPALRRGFLAGLRKMPGSVIEHRDEYVVGDLVGLEARHRFSEDGLTRRRWVRLLYQATAQVRLIAQGATVEDYDYWLPAFTSMIHTFRFGDRRADATGQEWLPSLPVAAGRDDCDDEDGGDEPPASTSR